MREKSRSRKSSSRKSRSSKSSSRKSRSRTSSSRGGVKRRRRRRRRRSGNGEEEEWIGCAHADQKAIHRRNKQRAKRKNLADLAGMAVS